MVRCLGFSEGLGLVYRRSDQVIGLISEFCVCRCVRFPTEGSPSRRTDSLPHTSECGDVFTNDTDH